MKFSELKKLSYKHPIILFDGVCNLCHSYIQWMLNIDKKKIFRYATLQSESGIEVQHEVKDQDSVLLLHEGNIYTQSDVAIKAATLIGGIHKVAILGRIIPKFIRNLIYRWIANHRYSWFGKKDACMIPSSEAKALFLE